VTSVVERAEAEASTQRVAVRSRNREKCGTGINSLAWRKSRGEKKDQLGVNTGRKRLKREKPLMQQSPSKKSINRAARGVIRKKRAKVGEISKIAGETFSTNKIYHKRGVPVLAQGRKKKIRSGAVGRSRCAERRPERRVG